MQKHYIVIWGGVERRKEHSSSTACNVQDESANDTKLRCLYDCSASVQTASFNLAASASNKTVIVYTDLVLDCRYASSSQIGEPQEKSLRTPYPLSCKGGEGLGTL